MYHSFRPTIAPQDLSFGFARSQQPFGYAADNGWFGNGTSLQSDRRQTTVVVNRDTVGELRAARKTTREVGDKLSISTASVSCALLRRTHAEGTCSPWRFTAASEDANGSRLSTERVWAVTLSKWSIDEHRQRRYDCVFSKKLLATTSEVPTAELMPSGWLNTLLPTRGRFCNECSGRVD